MLKVKRMFILPLLIISYLTLPLKAYAVDDVPEQTDAQVTTDITNTVIEDVPEQTTTPVTSDITTTETTVVTTYITLSTTTFAIYESGYMFFFKNMPDKTVYDIGDELDLTGLNMYLSLNDQRGNHYTIYNDVYPPDNPNFIVDTSEFDNSKAGTYRIRIVYKPEMYNAPMTLFKVTVNDPSSATTATSASTTENTTTTTVTTIISGETNTNTEMTTMPITTDAEGNVSTETSTVPSTTTTVTETNSTETTLPETGYSKWYQDIIASAVGMVGVGSAAIIKSGVFRKKKNNS